MARSSLTKTRRSLSLLADSRAWQISQIYCLSSDDRLAKDADATKLTFTASPVRLRWARRRADQSLWPTIPWGRTISCANFGLPQPSLVLGEVQMLVCRDKCLAVQRHQIRNVLLSWLGSVGFRKPIQSPDSQRKSLSIVIGSTTAGSEQPFRASQNLVAGPVTSLAPSSVPTRLGRSAIFGFRTCDLRRRICCKTECSCSAFRCSSSTRSASLGRAWGACFSEKSPEGWIANYEGQGLSLRSG